MGAKKIDSFKINDYSETYLFSRIIEYDKIYLKLILIYSIKRQKSNLQ